MIVSDKHIRIKNTSQRKFDERDQSQWVERYHAKECHGLIITLEFILTYHRLIDGSKAQFDKTMADLQAKRNELMVDLKRMRNTAMVELPSRREKMVLMLKLKHEEFTIQSKFDWQQIIIESKFNWQRAIIESEVELEEMMSTQSEANVAETMSRSKLIHAQTPDSL